MPRHHWGSLTDASAVMAAHWLLSSTTHSSYSIDVVLPRFMWLFELISMPFPAAISPVFQRVVGVLLHCLPADWCHQQTTSCKAVVLRWITTVGCQFFLHHQQSSRSPMDAEVSMPSALSFPGIYYIVLQITDILAALTLSFGRNHRHFHFGA